MPESWAKSVAFNIVLYDYLGLGGQETKVKSPSTNSLSVKKQPMKITKNVDR